MNKINKSALYIAPTPFHPKDYGNRCRVQQTLSSVTDLYKDVDFLLYPVDQDWQTNIPIDSEIINKFRIRNFFIAPPSIELHKNAKSDFHEIDEWWDPILDHFCNFLSARNNYSLVFVNYIFLSKAFKYFDSSIKILDTHDKFSGRKELFLANGLKPEFFYTTIDTERIGVNRADVIISIKNSERIFFENIVENQKNVINLPYLAPENSKFESKKIFKKIQSKGYVSYGFFGASNNVNVKNINNFLETFDRYFKKYSPNVEIVVAGKVCLALPDYDFVRKIGYVESHLEFYSEIDCVIAPIFFSTGLKIKVIEGLSFGLPVISSKDAFDGITPYSDHHQIGDVEEFSKVLIEYSQDLDAFAKLVNDSELSRQTLNQAVNSGLSELITSIKKRSASVLILIEKNIRNSKFSNLVINQLVQFIGLNNSTVVLYEDEISHDEIKKGIIEDKFKENIVLFGHVDKIHKDFPYIHFLLNRSYLVSVDFTNANISFKDEKASPYLAKHYEEKKFFEVSALRYDTLTKCIKQNLKDEFLILTETEDFEVGKLIAAQLKNDFKDTICSVKKYELSLDIIFEHACEFKNLVIVSNNTNYQSLCLYLRAVNINAICMKISDRPKINHFGNRTIFSKGLYEDIGYMKYLFNNSINVNSPFNDCGWSLLWTLKY